MSNDVIKKLRVGRKPKFSEEDVEGVKKVINETLKECFDNGIHPTDAILQAKLGIRSDKYITRYRNGVAPDQRVKEIQDMFQEYKTIACADLQQGGLDKTYDSKTANFLLQNNHGMSTKTEIEQSTATSIKIIDDM